MIKKVRFPILILFAVMFSFLQFFDITIFGAKPNFALAFIVTALFFTKEIWEGFFLVALASFILKFSPSSGLEILIFLVLGIVAVILNKYLPWHSFLNNLILIAAFTALFYAVLFPIKILSLVFILELIYNIIIGMILFLLFSRNKIFS